MTKQTVDDIIKYFQDEGISMREVSHFEVSVQKEGEYLGKYIIHQIPKKTPSYFLEGDGYNKFSAIARTKLHELYELNGGKRLPTLQQRIEE